MKFSTKDGSDAVLGNGGKPRGRRVEQAETVIKINWVCYDLIGGIPSSLGDIVLNCMSNIANDGCSEKAN